MLAAAFELKRLADRDVETNALSVSSGFRYATASVFAFDTATLNKTMDTGQRSDWRQHPPSAMSQGVWTFRRFAARDNAKRIIAHCLRIMERCLGVITAAAFYSFCFTGSRLRKSDRARQQFERIAKAREMDGQIGACEFAKVLEGRACRERADGFAAKLSLSKPHKQKKKGSIENDWL
jgi:hypothetical protein